MQLGEIMKLAGIDLAWNGEKNPSAIAVGCLINNELSLQILEPKVLGLSAILDLITNQKGLSGIAIDAPLIIENDSGQRECEKALSRDYAGRKASCHASNKSLYPNSLSVNLSLYLNKKGFQHLADEQWLIECYPHPAMIECFALPERLVYKKGKVADKKVGQIALARYILALESSNVLALKIPSELRYFLSESHIQSLKGKGLKSNEDALDAIICLYIAGLYQKKVASVTYGDSNQGYIWVPCVNCI